MPESKKQSLKRHAKKRFVERTNGHALTDEIYRAIVKQIHQGLATLIEKQSNTKSLYSVQVDGATYAVVWDRSRQSIVTFLTEEMIRLHLPPQEQT